MLRARAVPLSFILILASPLSARASAPSLEAMIGQMLVVNVDGFDYKGPLSVHPQYVEMVKRLQVGGVIAHYGTVSLDRIKAANRALAGLTDLPLLLCVDGVDLRAARGGPSASFGDRYVGGIIGRYGTLSDSEFRALAALNAFALAAIGVNTLLGPTVDDSTGSSHAADRARAFMDELAWFGIQPVIKHFPFLPPAANLHKESPDTLLSVEEVKRRASVFGPLSKESPFLMTTHVLDSLIDGDIVTFSSPWRRLLSETTGFTGLVMSDGLLMLSNYGDAAILGEKGKPRGGTGNAVDPGRLASWAVRAILAGHDLIIVEGKASVTETLFDSLLAAARSPQGARLKARIEESYARIAAFKESHRAVLTRRADVSAEALRTTVSLASRAAASSTPRLDRGALFLLRPALERAAAR